MALSSEKIRTYLADHPQLDVVMPVKASAVIYAGAMLMISGGAVTPVSGAGVFAGMALESATGGGSDGAVTCKVRVLGAFEMAVNTDTPAITDVGVAATVPEATDDDTLRIERAATVAGTAIGKFLRVIEPGTAGGKVAVSFKGASVG